MVLRYWVSPAGLLLAGLALLAALVSLGCAGLAGTGASESAVMPTPVALRLEPESYYGHRTPQPAAAVLGEAAPLTGLERPAEPAASNSEISRDSAQPEGRVVAPGLAGGLPGLVRPTAVPTPAVTPTPTIGPRPAVGPRAGEVPAVIELPAGWLELSCDQLFRQELVAWAGEFADFDVLVVAEVAEEIAALEQCAAEEWRPEFAFETGCDGVYRRMDGYNRLSVELRRERFETRDPFWGATGRDEAGNMIIHFARLPQADRKGCWYYSAREWMWLWAIPSERNKRIREEGRVYYSFPECGYMLRRYLAGWSERAVGGEMETELKAAEFGRALAQLRLDYPEQCGSPAWDPFIQVEPRGGCGPGLPTGLHREADLLVVNWHEEFPVRDGTACWVLDRAEGQWRDYYPPAEPDREQRR